MSAIEREGFDAADLEAHRPKLLAFVRSRVSDTATAEDIVQMGLVNAWRRQETYEPGRDLGAWLYGIVRNQMLDYFRAQRRKQETTLSESIPAADPFESVSTVDAFKTTIRWLIERDVSELGLQVAASIFFADRVTDRAAMLGIKQEKWQYEWLKVRPLLRDEEFRSLLLGWGSSTGVKDFSPLERSRGDGTSSGAKLNEQER